MSQNRGKEWTLCAYKVSEINIYTGNPTTKDGEPPFSSIFFPMILNLSASLAKRFKVIAKREPALHAQPYEEWYGHLFYAQKKPYILTIESISKFTVIIESKGLKNAEHYADALILGLMKLTKIYGLRAQLTRILESRANGLLFQRTTNRSSIANLNQMIYHAESNISERGMSVVEAALYDNEMPINAIDFFYPVEKFAGKKVQKTNLFGKPAIFPT